MEETNSVCDLSCDMEARIGVELSFEQTAGIVLTQRLSLFLLES